eukprot:16557_3
MEDSACGEGGIECIEAHRSEGETKAQVFFATANAVAVSACNDGGDIAHVSVASALLAACSSCDCPQCSGGFVCCVCCCTASGCCLHGSAAAYGAAAKAAPQTPAVDSTPAHHITRASRKHTC